MPRGRWKTDEDEGSRGDDGDLYLAPGGYGEDGCFGFQIGEIRERERAVVTGRNLSICLGHIMHAMDAANSGCCVAFFLYKKGFLQEVLWACKEKTQKAENPLKKKKKKAFVEKLW